MSKRKTWSKEIAVDLSKTSSKELLEHLKKWRESPCILTIHSDTPEILSFEISRKESARGLDAEIIIDECRFFYENYDLSTKEEYTNLNSDTITPELLSSSIKKWKENPTKCIHSDKPDNEDG